MPSSAGDPLRESRYFTRVDPTELIKDRLCNIQYGILLKMVEKISS